MFHPGNRAVALGCVLIASLSFASSQSFAKTPQTATRTAPLTTPTKNVPEEGTPNKVSVTPELEDKYLTNVILSSGPEPEDILPIGWPVRDWPVTYMWTNILSLQTPWWWQTVTPETLEVEHTYTYPNETLEPPSPNRRDLRGEFTVLREAPPYVILSATPEPDWPVGHMWTNILWPLVGDVEGIVLDQRGKPIANADIEVKGEQIGRGLLTKTDSAGRFTLQNLPPGVIYIYASKEKDGYLRGFSNFNAVPNDQSLISVTVEAEQTTRVTIKRRAGAYLKLNVTDEKGHRVPYGVELRRDDQPGQFWRESMSPGEKLQVPAVPFRLSVQSDGYTDWHYGGANYAGKVGLVMLKPGQTLALDVRLQKN